MKDVTPPGCPYCEMRDDDQDVVMRDDLVVFMQSRRHQGALRHSGIIIPVAHRETVFDLHDDELLATFRLLARVKAWMDDSFAPDGYNIGWNCGRVGGQEVFHAHLHVFPRSVGDGFGLTFGEHYWHRPAREELDEAAARIRAALGAVQ